MSNHKFDLIVISDCVLDIYYRVEKLPIDIGDIAVSNIIVTSPGGACATAVVARKLGLNVAVIDKVGDDAFSDILVKHLNDGSIYTGFMRRVHGTVTISNNIIGNNGHAFLGYLGVGKDLTINEVNEEVIKRSRAIYIGGFYASFSRSIINTFTEVIRMAHKHSIPVFLDVGPAIGNSELIIDLIKQSNTVFMNEEEMRRLFNDISILAKLARDNNVNAVVKLGDRGAVLVYNGNVAHCKPYNVNNVITTIGAGDAFNAAYIAGLLHGLDPLSSCDLGNRIASIRIQYLTPIELPNLEGFIM